MDNIDKIYKEKLLGLESDVSPHIWDNIDSILQKRRKNRRIFFFIAGIVLLGLILGGIYLLLSLNKTKLTKPSDIPVIAVSNSENNSEEKIDYPIVNPEIEGINQKSESPEAKMSIAISNLASLNSSEGVKQYYDDYFYNRNLETEIGRIPTAFKLPLMSDKSAKKGIMNNPESFKTHFYPKKNTGILDDCFPNKVNAWIFEAFSAPLFNSKALTGNNTQLIDKRYETESPLLSYSMGLRLGYNYKGGILKSGLEFTSVNEQFRVVLKNVISKQTIITIDTFKMPDGSYTITRDTTIKEIYGEEDIKKFNSYRYLGIPVIIGYELKYRRHSIGLNMGIIFNIMLRTSGCILDKDGKTINIKKSGDTIFRSNSGHSLFTGVLYSYALKDNFSLFVEPRLGYDLVPVTSKNYELKQRFHTYGISFGGRFLF